LLGYCTFNFEGHPRVGLLSPYQDKGTVADFVKTGTVTVKRKLQLLRDIAMAMEYMHNGAGGRPIVHGDIRAANALVSSDERALLADFGIAHILGSIDDVHTSSMNTNIRWQACELVMATVYNDVSDGNATVQTAVPLTTTESDVYAFGCVCYEVFFETVPYARMADGRLLLEKQQRRAPARLVTPQVDDIYWKFMNECWAAEPGDRPGASVIVKHLEKLISDIGKRGR